MFDEREKMRIKGEGMLNEVNEYVSDLVAINVTRNAYSSTGELERIKSQITEIKVFLGKLVEVMAMNRLIRPEDIETMTGTTINNPTFERENT